MISKRASVITPRDKILLLKKKKNHDYEFFLRMLCDTKCVQCVVACVS